MPEDVITMPAQEGPYRIPTSLIDAISDIQQYADTIEAGGRTQIPEGFLTLKRRLAYLNIGFIYGLGDNVVLWVISPFAYAVLFGLLPLFGRYHLTLFDKAFAFILSKYVTVGLLSLMIYLLTRIKGPLTKGCVSSLVSGYGVALFIRAVVFLLVYRWLYGIWPLVCGKIASGGDHLLDWAGRLERWQGTPLPSLLEHTGNRLLAFAEWLGTLRPVILVTSNYETLFAVLMIVILLGTWFYFAWRAKSVTNPYYERFYR